MEEGEGTAGAVGLRRTGIMKPKAESVRRRKLCQECGLYQWSAVTVENGFRRCMRCWVQRYFRLRHAD